MANDPDLLNRQVGRENTMFETRRQATGGSLTADNLADQADMGGFDLAPVANLMSGNFGTGLRQISTAIGQKLGGQNDATRALIVKALMSSDPEMALTQAMKQAGSDQGKRNVIEAMLRQVQRPVQSTINP